MAHDIIVTRTLKFKSCVWISYQQKCLMKLYSEFNIDFVSNIYMPTIRRDLVKINSKRLDYEHCKGNLFSCLGEKNEICYDKMTALNQKIWTRSHFSTYCKSDMLMYNISKSFNGRILKARDKPNLTMIEWIRSYWIIRIHVK
ncbi:hypothetical protein CR513_27615, partial [Mucuna pruriens]